MKQLTALLAIFAMVLSLTACGKNDKEVEALRQENAQLQSQIQALQAQLGEIGGYAGLEHFRLDTAVWESGGGATLTFAVTPPEQEAGQSAAIRVLLEGVEVVSIPCDWDGEAFTASVDVAAADGYTYLCTITDGQGKENNIVLNGPEMDKVIYLATNLSAYANMVVTDFVAEEESLTLTGGFIQVQLPRMGGDTAVESTRLVLEHNGQEFLRQEVELLPGEGEGSFELLLADLSLPMPRMNEDSQLDVYLEVTLTNGQYLSAMGGSWMYLDGELVLVVG